MPLVPQPLDMSSGQGDFVNANSASSAAKLVGDFVLLSSGYPILFCPVLTLTGEIG